MAIGWLVLALAVAAVVLNVLGPLRGVSEKRMRVFDGFPPEMVVEVTPETMRGWLLRMAVAAVLLEVLLPGVLYAIFAEEIGRSGVLVGMLFWGGAWIVGALPQFVFEPMMIRVPPRYVLHNVGWSLAIYAAIGAVVGAIYAV